MERKACAECKHNCKEDFKGVCLKCLNNGGKEFEGKPTDAVRLIDANTLIRRISDRMGDISDGQYSAGLFDGLGDAIYETREAPTIEAEPVVHAHWVRFDQSEPPVYFICPKCGRMLRLKEGMSIKDFPYCNCGAKMDEDA